MAKLLKFFGIIYINQTLNTSGGLPCTVFRCVGWDYSQYLNIIRVVIWYSYVEYNLEGVQDVIIRYPEANCLDGNKYFIIC